MQFTIDLEKVVGKLRYILLGILVLLTFFFRDTTPNETSEEKVAIPEQVEEVPSENNMPATDEPAPSNLVLEEEDLEKAVVRQIIDGNTVELQFAEKRIDTVKLLLIRAPIGSEPYSEQAIQRLRELIIKDSVVEVEEGEMARDKEGNLLVYIWKDSQNINLKLVQEGFAQISNVEHPNTKYVEAFYEGQALAQSQKLNIWQ